MPKPGQTQAQATALAAEREAQAVQLYSLGGMTYDEIAEAVGYETRGGAQKAVTRGLKRRYDESTADRDAAIQRHLEITREVIRHMGPGLRKGNPRSAEVIIQALAREARMLGLDAPVKADVKITDAMMAEIEELAEQMHSLDAQQAQQEAAKARG